MARLHPDAVGDLLEWAGPQPDEVLREMERRAIEDDFPTVGPEVGRTLACCTRLLGAESVLECGSGFGYSAYWIARALPNGGSITLTERDRDLLADAREYFERGGIADRANFEVGDALEIASEIGRRDVGEDACDANHPFDLVVLDHDTADYVAGFEAVRELVAPGGTVVVDNVAIYEGSGEAGDSTDRLDPGELHAALESDACDAVAPNERTRTVAAVLERLRDDPAFELFLLPVGEGLAIAWKRG